MPLSDFFLPRAARLMFGGEMLEVRALTLEQVFRLWPVLSGNAQRWINLVQASVHDGEWCEAAAREAWGILFPLETTERFELATPEETRELFAWYVEAHQWARIFRDVFGVGVDDGKVTKGEENDAVDWLYFVEQKTERRIEELLAMTPEAYMSFRDALGRCLDRRPVAPPPAGDPGKGRMTIKDAPLEALDMIGLPISKQVN